MKVSELIHVFLYFATVVLGGFALWYKSNVKLHQTVSFLIADAENQYKNLTGAGGIKFEWVVGQLYGLVPAVIRPFVPRTLVRTLVQAAFDAIAGYAQLQLDRLTEKGPLPGDMEELHGV